MFPLLIVLVLVALTLAVASSGGRVPLWGAVLVLCIIELIQLWPR